MARELFNPPVNTQLDNLAEQYMNIDDQIRALKQKQEALEADLIHEMKKAGRGKISLRGKTLEPTMISTKLKLKISKGTKV